MIKSNNLSNCLKVYQSYMDSNLSELSNELGITRSNLKSILPDGKASLNMLIHVSDTLGISLDALVFEKSITNSQGILPCLLKSVSWYLSSFDENRKEISGIIKVVISWLVSQTF